MHEPVADAVRFFFFLFADAVRFFFFVFPRLVRTGGLSLFLF